MALEKNRTNFAALQIKRSHSGPVRDDILREFLKRRTSRVLLNGNGQNFFETPERSAGRVMEDLLPSQVESLESYQWICSQDEKEIRRLR